MIDMREKLDMMYNYSPEKSNASPTNSAFKSARFEFSGKKSQNTLNNDINSVLPKYKITKFNSKSVTSR